MPFQIFVFVSNGIAEAMPFQIFVFVSNGIAEAMPFQIVDGRRTGEGPVPTLGIPDGIPEGLEGHAF